LRKPQVLRGFLHELRASNPVLAAQLLDAAVEHESLALLYPFLQAAVPIENEDIARIKRSLALGKAPITMYTSLAYATDGVPAVDLRNLVLTIAGFPAGYDIGIEILQMRLHTDEKHKQATAPEIIDTGCELLRQFSFTNKTHQEDYRLPTIAKACLTGARGIQVTTEVCHNLKAAIRNRRSYTLSNDDLLQGALPCPARCGP
jgi:hypothetical protein